MTTTASALQITINDDVAFGSLDTQIATGSETRYQRVCLKYNGLYWELRKTQQSTNEQNYYNSSTNLQVPYSVKLGTNKCTKLKLIANSVYDLKSGTIYIYGR